MKLKTIISALMCMTMLTTAYAQSAITVENSLISETGLTYNLSISQSGTLISALYSEDGELIKVESEAVTSGSKTKSITLDTDDEKGKVKFMLWNSVSGMTPVSDSAYQTWDKADIPKIVKVMPLGDSITDGFNVAGGYRNTLEAKILADGISANVDFVGSSNKGTGYDNDNEGHSGWSIEAISSSDDIEGKGRKGLMTNIDGWMKTYAPDIVLLQIGTNDILSQYKLSEAQTRLGTLVDKILAGLADGGKVYIAKIPYISISANYNKTGITDQTVMDGQVDEFNKAVEAVAQAKGLTVVDVNGTLALTDLSDGIHPNSSGYEKLGNLWYNTIIGELNTRIN